METVLVWVLVLTSYNLGMLKVENISTFEDCERLRQRVVHAHNTTPSSMGNIAGSCTQIAVVVPRQSVNIAPAQITVTPAKPTVIIKEKK